MVIMFEKIFSVKYVSLKNCFLYFPSSVKHESSESYYKIVHEAKITYFSSCAINTKLDDNSIGLNSLFAKSLGIKEGTLVNVSGVKQLPAVKSITICPLSKDDYEVLELLSDNVQATLLEHVRVVGSGQNLVIWIGNNIVLNVYVEEVTPTSPGVLGFLSEVVVKTPNDIASKSNILKKSKDACVNPVSELTKFADIASNGGNNQLEVISRFLEVKQDCIFRVIPLEKLNNFCQELNKTYKTFHVFASKLGFPQSWRENTVENAVFCAINVLTSSMYAPQELFARLYFLEDVLPNFKGKIHPNNIFIKEEMFVNLECDLGDRVILTHIHRRTDVNEIEIHAKSSIFNVKEKVKRYLADNSEQAIILTAEVAIEIEKNLNAAFVFLPERSMYCIIEGDFLRDVKYSIIDVPLNKKDPQKKMPDVNGLLEITNFQEIINDVLLNFKTEEKNMGCLDNVLCTGKPGTGKTTLLQIILQKLNEYPYLVHTDTIQCKKIKGKTADSLHKLFTLVFCRLVLSQPSVLFLDDLHVLCENVTKGEETPNSIYFNRVSEMLYGFLNLFSKYSKIGIVASAESTAKLNSNIYKSRGNSLFKNVYCINQLDKSDRNKLLKFLFKEEDIDYSELSMKTDGFVIQDIVDFYNKAVFEACKDDEEDNIKICTEHCNRALNNTTALSLQNVKFHEGETKSFDDIGGLYEVKKALIESLLWPAEYPNIFGLAPLRPQSGILLYGPPGTGKTLIAGAAAQHCGLRLISVKGPELLSKYIGASEQAVRDVFDKAQSAKPCILFFDEFDSLAPRRGHDNTGVTDRVVNQLLTRLDGVEALVGVSVLAATSRPDLLDPALLRPGRLDRQLYCPLPDVRERFDILSVLAQNLELSDDADLKNIAERTVGYSGADLQSILYTAQLSSVDHLWKSNEVENSSTNTYTTKITKQHLEDALRRTKPSLTNSERGRYERIYNKFHGGIVAEDIRPGSKATLA